MAASAADISEWFDKGIAEGATHMIIVCDTWDYDDYPVYVKKGEDVHKREKKYNDSNMQKVMEVYNLSISKDEQMKDNCSFHY